jgi:MerR family transcriptional regulator, light-induced transcriptional regulator
MPRSASVSLPTATGWPVAAAAGRVGVSISTLRSWERRYGLRPTGRTVGGHRRYTARDIARLQRLERLVQHGMPTAEAAAAVLEGPAARASARRPAATDDPQAFRLRAAADRLDLPAAISAARAIIRSRGLVPAWTDAFVPALQAAGTRWERTGTGVECEHLLADAIQVALTRYTYARQNGSAPRVVLAATEEECHILPLHAVAAALAEREIASSMLGTLPPAGLFAAVDRLGPEAVVLWARSEDVADADELTQLSRRVPLTCAAGLGWSRRRRRATKDLASTVELLDAWLRGSEPQPAHH